MPGFNPDKINIHELAIEEPEKQSKMVFDPKEYLTDEDWKKMDKWLDECRELNEWDEFTRQALAMHFIDSERDLPLTEESLKKMKDKLDEYADKGDWRTFVWQATAIKTVRPDIDLGIGNESEWKKLRTNLEKTLSPNAQWRSWLRGLLPCFGIENLPKNKISKDKRRLDHIKENGDGGPLFSWSAMVLNIEQQGRLIVTDRGLEIVPRGKLLSEFPPLPETKQF